jgi:hypothetical protein
MIIRLLKSVRYTFVLRKSFHSYKQEEYEKSLYYLDKCKKIFGDDKVQASLLRSLVFYESKKWKEALVVSNESIHKIDDSKALNDDEKKYLKAFATDTINCVILKTQDDPKFIPVDMSFNRDLVDSMYKHRFIVKPR